MDISLGTLIGQMGTFMVLVFVTMKFVWPPVTNAMEERRRKIAEGLAHSEEADKALAKANDEAREILRDARRQAGEIIEQASQRSNQLVEQARQDALTERDKQVQAAEEEILLATNQAREALRQRVAELAMVGAGRVIEKEIDEQRHREMLDQLAAEL